MPRKRTKTEDTVDHQADHIPQPEGPVTAAAVIDAPANDVEHAFAEAGLKPADEIAPPAHQHDANGHAEGNGQEKPRLQPVKGTFRSSPAGVYAAEDKRFPRPQVFVDFADDARATDEEKAALKEAGFRYRPTDKGYSALATPETRQARDELARSFADRRLKEMADQGEGQSR